MATIFENFGLEVFLEADDEELETFFTYLASEGKPLMGYNGNPYLFKRAGSAEFWFKTAINHEEETISIEKIHLHCGNTCVWNVECTDIDITPKDNPDFSKVIFFNNAGTSSGFLPIEVITADVMPSFLAGDKMKMQVVALPLEVNYHKNEEEYMESLDLEDKQKWPIGDGALLPIHFLNNHSIQNYEANEEYETDKYIHFRATVKKLYKGVFELDENKHNTFIRCLVDTAFGELEFAHSVDQVAEDQRENIKIGSVISGVCIISGDAAIYEYDKGIIRDFEHNLKLLRNIFATGNPERLITVLADDAIYDSDNYEEKIIGKHKIIEFIKHVDENRESRYITKYATITEIDEDASSMEYSVGTKCFVLAEKDCDYESIVFITVNEEGLISKIKISNDGRYFFEVDEPNKKVSLWDSDFENYEEDSFNLYH